MSPPVRIALLGAGLIGRGHADLIGAHPETTLAGIVDVTAEAEALAERLGVPYADDVERLLDETAPDAVIVALPNQLHVTAGLACIRRGLPVLVEKPIADTVESALELVERAERAGVPVLVGHHRRHAVDIRAAREALDRGALGRLVAVSALCVVRKHEAYFDTAWRREPGGGPILINAIHDVDVLRYLCGEIESVQAISSHAARGLAVEDTVAVALRFETGVLGTLLLTDSAPSPYFWEIAAAQSLALPPKPEDCYHLFGTRASLAVPTMTTWRYDEDGDWRDPLHRGALETSASSCYVAQLDNLVAVARGDGEPVVSGREGMLTLAATLAIARAAAEGRPVAPKELGA